MRRARRATYVFVRLTDELLPDLDRLLQGRVELTRGSRIVALSAVTGDEVGISLDELRALSSLSPTTWTKVADVELEGEARERLAAAGLVIGDADDEPYATLRSRDERLAETGWDGYAALYHTYSKWKDVDVGELPVAAPPGAPARPPPPPPFHSLPSALETIDLPLDRTQGGIFRLLAERKTTRGLDPQASLTRDELGVLLYHTFGCQGFLDLGDGLVVLRKTSPSGGSLHPVEAYPLVINVEGVATGLHHYRPDRHALDLVVPLDRDAAREQLVSFTAGQTYLSGAAVLVVMTARFARSFWKYRHPRGYAVVLMDAAHLSQTLYLVASELGLGAFVSAAVNAGNIEEYLGVDGLEEGVVAVCGVGRAAARPSPYDPRFEPYVPRETVIGAGP